MNKAFLSFLSEREQRVSFLVFSAISLAILVLMRIFYPFPFSYSDTGAYVLSAFSNNFNAFRPMGYSHYLRILHSISSSIYFVFYLTYFLMFVANTFFLFSAKYLMNIKSNICFIFFGILLITNVRLVFATNLLMSDGIFIIFSIFYFAIMLWLLKKPSILLALVEIAVIYLMCDIRYSGLFFIPVIIFVFIFSFHSCKRWLQLVMICLPILAGGLFYKTTKTEYKQHIKVDTFSGFGGWQSINNASVLLPEAKSLPMEKFKTENLKNLHCFIQSCPDEIFNDENTFSTFYMWSNELPYKIYNSCLQYYSQSSYPHQWAATGKLYGEYSKILIKNYPWKYFTNFIVPSFFSNFKFKKFEEDDTELVNEEMYRKNYGLSQEQYVQKCQFFNRIEPVWRIMHFFFWGIFLLSVIALCTSIKKGCIKDDGFIISVSLLLGILVILAGQSVSSPNTTWRYTAPLIAPMLIFILSQAARFCRWR